ncbi:MAG: nitrous oxide reductase family maturation protein NosD [Gemmatimonadaceae bacterium]|nr:nitrous oxide reductase family maturation protein NosD [Gemmatimonadaceae bacterium]
MHTPRAAGLVLLLASAAPVVAQEGAVVRVGPGSRYARIGEAVAAAPHGARIVIGAATYREPMIVVRRPMTLVGEPGARLDGEGARTILLIEADDVTVEGLTFVNTGSSQVDERAGIRARNARACTIRGNRLEATAFAISLERTVGCRVSDNTIRGTGGGQMETGNGIHAWYSDSLTITGNAVSGHRDGIYFEFVTAGQIHRNVAERNARYGLHFMFSHDCTYDTNTFRANGNGVAVMYSHTVTMTANTFEKNIGSAAYGLLLKDIDESQVRGNRFLGNSVGLYLEDAGRNQVIGNRFAANGWGLKVLASAQGNVFSDNVFEGNAFDVGTNSRSNYSTFRGNYWDRYTGYDLDRDGIGDVPFAPVRLFALVVEQSPASLVLLRSMLVDLLDLAERALPAIAPDVRDEAPRTRAPQEAAR